MNIKLPEMPITTLVIIMATSLLSSGLKAHDRDHYAQAESLARSWALSISSANPDAFAQPLASDFTWIDLDFGRPLNRQNIRLNRDEAIRSKSTGESEISFDRALYSRDNDKLVITQIKLEQFRKAIKSVLEMTLTKNEGEWQISEVRQRHLVSPELAARLWPQNHAEQQVSIPVRFQARDSRTGTPLAIRINITDKDGEHWPPLGRRKYPSLGWNDDVGGSVFVSGKVYSYVNAEFTALLPPGSYELSAFHGTEYVPLTKTFLVEIEKASHSPISLELDRWIEPEKNGWYSGDTHAHFIKPSTALLEAEAEGLSIAYLLATRWGEWITDIDGISLQPAAAGESGVLVVYNQETRHRVLGHTILHPLDKPIYPLTWGPPNEGIPGGFDYPAMAHVAESAHAVDALVTWAHFPHPGGELLVDASLGKIDTVDLFTWQDAFQPRPGFLLPTSAVDHWYRLLNTGARLAATAGTDKMYNLQVLGSARTYVRLGNKPFSYGAWIEGIRAGRTFVTTGPIIDLTVSGAHIGDTVTTHIGETLRVSAMVEAPHKLFPWKKLEIIYNGDVVASVDADPSSDQQRLQIDLPIAASGWLAARAYVPTPHKAAMSRTGDNRLPPMAHTSPIYLEVPGTIVWSNEDAEFLHEQCSTIVHWAQNDAKYQTETDRLEIVNLYRTACDKYLTVHPRTKKNLNLP